MKNLSRRVENLPPYLFVEISKKIAEKKAKGEEVISFAVGDPDMPTPPNVIERLCEAAQDPANHHYPESDSLPELRQTIAKWYNDRFNVSLDANKEVLPLIGSKEGIHHIALCFVNPGDTVQFLINVSNSDYPTVNNTELYVRDYFNVSFLNYTTASVSPSSFVSGRVDCIFNLTNIYTFTINFTFPEFYYSYHDYPSIIVLKRKSQ